MELLPIIYTSLIIVSVLITATIIVSFISYKIRQNKEGNLKVYEKFPADKKPEHKASKPKPRPSHQKPKEDKPKSERTEKERSEPRTVNKASTSHKPKQQRTERPLTPVKRIEIIDELKPVKKITKAPSDEKPKENKPDKKKINKMHTLGDDVLNKYADNDDDDFHHLSVDK